MGSFELAEWLKYETGTESVKKALNVQSMYSKGQG